VWEHVIYDVGNKRQGNKTDKTDTSLTASFLGQPGQAGTRKGKPIWILMKQEPMAWQHVITQFLQAGCSS